MWVPADVIALTNIYIVQVDWRYMHVDYYTGPTLLQLIYTQYTHAYVMSEPCSQFSLYISVINASSHFWIIFQLYVKCALSFNEWVVFFRHSGAGMLTDQYAQWHWQSVNSLGSVAGSSVRSWLDVKCIHFIPYQVQYRFLYGWSDSRFCFVWYVTSKVPVTSIFAFSGVRFEQGVWCSTLNQLLWMIKYTGTLPSTELIWIFVHT